MDHAPSAAARLSKFCEEASRLSDEETSDWPPFFTLRRSLTVNDYESDFEQIFAMICLHSQLIVGESGGWNEIMRDYPAATG